MKRFFMLSEKVKIEVSFTQEKQNKTRKKKTNKQQNKQTNKKENKTKQWSNLAVCYRIQNQ